MFRFLFDFDTWQELSESLTKNKIRTIITMIGVWWGILLLIALLGSARGIENKFNVEFGDYATNSVFIWGQATSMPFKGYQEGRAPRLKFSHLDKIKNNTEGIKFLVPRNSRQSQVVRGILSAGFGIIGDLPLLDLIQKKNLTSGRFINQNDIEQTKKVAVISTDAYEQLFEKDEVAIGEYIELDDISYKVIGVFKQGDFVIVRTGQMEQRLDDGEWGGYAGGDAPGLAFETAEWAFDNEISAVCTDTWGCEVRPNEIADAFQPWHWVVIPKMGLTLGEIFYLKDIGEDCAADGVYEFLFCAPPLPITGAVGSPINPIVLK